MIILEQIRKNLVSAIRESGLSQTEIARRLNIKQQTVQQYVSGRAMPALDTFANRGTGLNRFTAYCRSKGETTIYSKAVVRRRYIREK